MIYVLGSVEQDKDVLLFKCSEILVLCLSELLGKNESLKNHINIPLFYLFFTDIQPPDGKPKDCMLQIVCRDGKTVSLCAESTDDCL